MHTKLPGKRAKVCTTAPLATSSLCHSGTCKSLPPKNSIFSTRIAEVGLGLALKWRELTFASTS